MTFRPVSPHKEAVICLGIALAAGALGTWLVQTLPSQPISAAMFWGGFFALISFGLLLYFLYLAFSFLRLRYHLDRNGLQICWGGVTRRIPMQRITDVVPADEVALPAKRFLFLLLPLPGWWVGSWAGATFYATAGRQQSLVAQTKEGSIVISPADPQAFLRAWRLRVPLGPTQIWSREVIRWPLFNHSFWFDSLTWRLAGGALLLYIILLGATLTAYPSWPPVVPIGLNAFGQADAIVNRRQVLWLPAAGGIILLFNLILGALWYKQERLAAYLLWLVALLIQIGLWIAIRAIAG